MEIQEGLKTLANKYSHQPWYDSVGLDKYGRYVVYVHIMNMEIMQTVEPSLNGKQVLMHYASSKPENMKKYITEYNLNRTSLPAVTKDFLDELIDERTQKNPNFPQMVDEAAESIIDIDELVIELDRLEKICGVNGLESIFYEVHDGNNAVTNLGARYPEVKKSIQKLYNKYGFDIIYEELEG